MSPEWKFERPLRPREGASPWEWSWYTWGWIVLFVGIAILEIIALVDPREHDTLSAHVKYIMRNKLVRLIIMLFLTWLIIHFATGGWI